MSEEETIFDKISIENKFEIVICLNDTNSKINIFNE